MYLSKTITGNKTELVPHYGEWNDYSTYKFENIKLDNLLDITSPEVMRKLAVDKNLLTKIIEIPKGTPDDVANKIWTIMYEFPNEIASWAKKMDTMA